MANTNFVIGRGTVIQVAMLPDGVETEPVSIPTLTATPLVAKGATSIGLGAALPANSIIPAGSYLNFTDSVSGKEVLVQLTADAEATDTTLAVAAVPATIADNSTSSYPLKLKTRTAANLGRSANRVSSVTFDDDAWERGLSTALNATLEVPGNWSQLDASYNTMEYAFNNLRQVYCWLTTKSPNADYSKGKTYKGVFSITEMPLEIPADGIVSGNISLALNGPLVLVNPTPTA